MVSSDEESDNKSWDSDDSSEKNIREKDSGEDELDDDSGAANESDDESDDEEDDSSLDKIMNNNDNDLYDHEMGEKVEQFEDEASSRVFDHRDYEERPKTRAKEIPWWDGNEKIIAIVLACCCCLCLIIIGLVVGVVVGGGSNANGSNEIDNGGSQPTLITPRPTIAPQPLPPSAKPPPTEFPTAALAKSPSPIPVPSDKPTVAPTISSAPTKSIPEKLGIIADQDTYVNLDGEDQGEEYGDMDTFLVQNGPIADETIPDAVGLVTFRLDDVPSLDRLSDTPKNAVLRLTHRETTTERGSAVYTIVRLPETRVAAEYLHGYSFLPPEDEDDIDGVMVGPSFEVDPDSLVIDIDITSLLFDYEPESNQLFLMIQNRGPEQEEGGDRFYTRESATPPQLLVDFVGGDAADIIVELAMTSNPSINYDFDA